MKVDVRISQCKPGSFKASCPSLPGCVVYASSHADAKQRIEDAVQGYLASLDTALPRELSRVASFTGT